MPFTEVSLTEETAFTEVALTTSTSFSTTALTASTDFDIVGSIWEDAAELLIGSWDAADLINWEDLA